MNRYTPNAKCSPSRACVLTGRNPWQNGAAADHGPCYPPELKTWMEALADTEYTVGYTGKGWGPGEVPPERKNIPGQAWQKKKAKKTSSEISTTDYAGNLADFLPAAPSKKPSCFWYGGHEPHRSYHYGSGVAKGGYK